MGGSVGRRAASASSARTHARGTHRTLMQAKNSRRRLTARPLLPSGACSSADVADGASLFVFCLFCSRGGCKRCVISREASAAHKKQKNLTTKKTSSHRQPRLFARALLGGGGGGSVGVPHAVAAAFVVVRRAFVGADQVPHTPALFGHWLVAARAQLGRAAAVGRRRRGGRGLTELHSALVSGRHVRDLVFFWCCLLGEGVSCRAPYTCSRSTKKQKHAPWSAAA